MIDIVAFSDGDLQIYDAQVPKAANVLSVQIGALEYAQDFGIDLNFFIDPEFQFENASFKAYLIQRLSESHVNVSAVLVEDPPFIEKMVFFVGETEKPTGGFIR